MSGTVDFDEEITAQAPAPTSGPVNSSFSTNSFVQRNITVILQLGQGSFGDSGFNTVTLAGLRVVATIQKSAAPGSSVANFRIYGIPLDVMNQLSTLGVPIPIASGRHNIVTVQAGDSVNGMATVFHGNTYGAWADLNDMPETYFTIDARSGAFEAMKPIAPTSLPQGGDVAKIVSGLATQMGRLFENNGVQVQLSSSYFPGTAKAQLDAIKRAARIELDDDGRTIAIWPRNGSRNGAVPLISPQSGMIGYPQYTSQGVRLRTIFNPSIVFGGNIMVQSSITPASGMWHVNELTLNLSSQIAGGPWFSDIGAVRLATAGAPAAHS